jgi:crossover junction endodeoxyribonuclease RuvC
VRTIIGIDPGLSGGIAVIHSDGRVIAEPMPVVETAKGKELDEQELISLLQVDLWPKVFIERVHAMPKQGVVSMFTFGVGWGLVRGICAGLGLSYELVRPQEWQKAMLEGHPKGSEYLVASRLFPGTDWRASPRCKKAHDGMVDAALIAEYGRRK